jgi:hypothetical protein
MKYTIMLEKREGAIKYRQFREQRPHWVQDSNRRRAKFNTKKNRKLKKYCKINEAECIKYNINTIFIL